MNLIQDRSIQGTAFGATKGSKRSEWLGAAPSEAEAGDGGREAGVPLPVP